MSPLLKPMTKPDRLLPWLKLGESTYSLSLKRNPSRLFPRNSSALTAKQLAEQVAMFLKELTEIVYAGTDNDKYRSMLHLGEYPRNEAIKLLCIALVAWMRLGVPRPETSINMVTTVLADALDGTKHQNILTARRTLFELVNSGILSAKDGDVCPQGTLAYYLATNDHLIVRALTKPEHAISDNDSGSEATSKKERQQKSIESVFKEFVKKLDVPRPMELDKLIQAEGYVGQAHARRAISLSAYRHIRRIKAIHIEGKDPNTLPKKDCLLLVGETGSGKTHLCEIVFQRLLKIPTVIYDASTITSDGYCGGKLSFALTRLYSLAGNNTKIAEVSVLVLDELDKLAGVNSSSLPGERINKDIGGDSAQKTLLTILQGGMLSVANVGNGSGAWEFNGRDSCVLMTGAFSGLLNKRNQSSEIGFGSVGVSHQGGRRIEIQQLVDYGMIAELMGRITQIISMDRLDRHDLKQILQRTITTRYFNELQQDAVELSVVPEVLDLLVDRALGLKTGARGLANGLSEAMQDALYEVYSVDGVKGLRLVKNGDQIGHELIRKASKRSSKIPPEAPSTVAQSFSTVVSAI